jgi:hypothetical protein
MDGTDKFLCVWVIAVAGSLTILGVTDMLTSGPCDKNKSAATQPTERTDDDAAE